MRTLSGRHAGCSLRPGSVRFDRRHRLPPPKDVASHELLVKFADEALYRAKHDGRNTICLYQAQSYRYEVGDP